VEKRIGIIGGGPCGLACAIELAQKGFDVDVYEKKNWPIYKVCGEGIMPSGHEILKGLGIFKYLDQSDFREFEGIEYYQYGIPATKANFEKNKKGIAISRIKLSEALFLRCGDFSNIKLHPYTEIIDTKSLDHDRIILCEGIRGKIKSKLNLGSSINQNRKRMGAHAYFNIAWANKFIELHWGENIEAYITPITSNKTQLTILWDENKVKPRGKNYYFSILKQFFPHLSQFTIDKMDGRVSSYGPFNTKSRCIQYGRYIFAGDDLYFLDGITGEGITLSLKQAKLLSGLCFNEENYKAKVFNHISNYELFTRLSLLKSSYRNFRRFGLNLFQAFDKLFPYFLKLNDGTEELTRKEKFIIKIFSIFINKDYRPNSIL